MGSNWYPQWVYDKREDITRKNMRQYDEKRKKMYDEIEEQEEKLGRLLTLQERMEIRDKIMGG